MILVFLISKCDRRPRSKRLRGGELGDGLGAFGDGVLGEFTREDQSDRGLDLAGRDRRLLVVAASLAASAAIFSKMSLMNEFMMDIALEEMPVSGCTCFKHLVDVDLVGFGLGLASNLLGARGLLLSGLLGHFECIRVVE